MLRFASQLAVDNLPDEQLTDQFEVIMPELAIMPIDEIPIEDQGTISRIANGVGGFFSKYRPIVEQITFSQMAFETETRRIRTGWYNVPKDIKQWSDVKIVMFCSASMTTQHYLDAWKSLMFNKRGEYYYPGARYKKNIEVFVYGSGGTGLVGTVTPKNHWTLVGCFPSEQEDYQLEYTDDPKRFRIQATFKVDNIIKDTSATRSTVISEMVTSPTELFDRGLSALSSNSTYTINEAYGGSKPSPSMLDTTSKTSKK